MHDLAWGMRVGTLLSHGLFVIYASIYLVCLTMTMIICLFDCFSMDFFEIFLFRLSECGRDANFFVFF
jgi:hypothetical protein